MAERFKPQKSWTYTHTQTHAHTYTHTVGILHGAEDSAQRTTNPGRSGLQGQT